MPTTTSPSVVSRETDGPWMVTVAPGCFDAGRCVGHEVSPGSGTRGLRYCPDTAVSRRAFEVLDVARTATAIGYWYSGDPRYASFFDAVSALPAEGGTVGPLPDGCTIVVERLDADAFLAEWWSRAQAINLSQAIEAHNAFAASQESGGAR